MFTIVSRLDSYRGDASEDHALILRAAPKTLVLAVASGSAAPLAIETIQLEGTKLTRRDSRLFTGFFRALDTALTARDAGQATLVALCLTPRQIVGASVGDSEAWWITAEGHFDLTEAQKRRPYLGTGATEPIPFELKLTQPGTLLLATDGLFKYAEPAAVMEAVRTAESLEAAADALLALVAPVGRFYDDLALVLVRLDTIGPWTRFLNRFKAG